MNLMTFNLAVLPDTMEISESVIFATLLLSAIVIFLTSHFCEEACARLRLPAVLADIPPSQVAH